MLRDQAIESALRDERAIARFWSKVRKGDSCWEWTAGAFRGGYGCFHIANKSRWRACSVKASRFAWAIENGRVPFGLLVRHTCDNPACVRPSHLIVGTQTDNMRDAVVRGRQSRGEGRPLAKMTDERVRALRERRAQGISFMQLAREFGISDWTVRGICGGRRWKHVV